MNKITEIALFLNRTSLNNHCVQYAGDPLQRKLLLNAPSAPINVSVNDVSDYFDPWYVSKNKKLTTVKPLI